jgi:peptide/nickel transport system permease protein
MGLDEPVYAQYLIYLGNLVRGDLGQSFTFAQPVSEVIGARLFNTALLAFVAIVLASVIGVAAGTWAALKPGSLRDQALSVAVLFFNSMPSFWLGLVLIMIFGLHLRLLPVSGMSSVGGNDGLLGLAAHMVLPSITLAAWSLATIARMTRSSLLEVINSDYIRTARAKGVGRRRVLLHHAFRNTLIPMVTLIGLELPTLLSGSIILEQIFGWPGMGKLFFESIRERDYPTMMGLVLMFSVLTLLGQMLADFLYAVVDPRVTYH